jgi:hypothetical protein
VHLELAWDKVCIGCQCNWHVPTLEIDWPLGAAFLARGRSLGLMRFGADRIGKLPTTARVRRCAVTRTKTAGTRMLLVGLVAAAIATATAAAAMPVFLLHVRAQLAPVGGTSARGQFSGVLFNAGVEPRLQPNSTLPPPLIRWRLTWKLSLPSLRRPATATLRFGTGSAAARVLCKQCARHAEGGVMLTAAQERGMTGSHAVVVVRTRSARLRGAIKVVLQLPVPSRP